MAHHVGQRLFQGGARLQVVVLDEDAVGQVQAMVVAAAHANAVLVQKPVSRRGFAGIDDAGAGAGHGAHIMVGGGGDAAHALHEVQGGAFGPQNGGGGAAHAGDVRTRGQVGAVVQYKVDLKGGVDAVKHLLGDGSAGQDAGGLGAQDAVADDAIGYERLGGGVVERLVLGEGGVDEVEHFGWEHLGHVGLAACRQIMLE